MDLGDYQSLLIDCCLLRTPHSLTQQVELKSCLKLDSDSEEDPEEVTELEPELGPSAEQPPIAQGNQQQLTGIQTRTRTVVPPGYYCC